VSLTVRILPRAEADFKAIYSYIAQRSPSGAIRWRTAFENSIRSASENPELFGYAPEDRTSERDIHQVLFKTPRGLTYRGIFTIRESELFILRIRGQGQPPLRQDEMPIP